VTFARLEPRRFGRVLLFRAPKIAAKDAISWLRGSRKPGTRPPEAGASHLFMDLFFLFAVLFSALLPACFAPAPFPSLFQYLVLYSAPIGAL
jgi:hypothetical protein